MPPLTGGVQPVALGFGYALRAPGVRGLAELRVPASPESRARGRAVEDGTPALESALAATNVTEVRQIDLSVQAITPGPASTTLRSADGRQEAVELIVPDLGPEVGQIVLASDESGVLTWHLPVNGAGTVQDQATRGAGGTKTFRIPATRLPPASPEEARSRGLIGAVVRKVLKVLVYPVTDPVVGPISEFFAERWEAARRPYRLRDFAPGAFRDPVAMPLGDGDWARLTEGRALLFIHGTFSTAHGAFALMPDDVFGELHRRYGGRVFAFDHFTLSHDPVKNVEWLLSQVPVSLDLDIVCHSRGGLVARTLVDRASAAAPGGTKVAVGRIAFVGVPNAGTVLADPDHMVAMIDRLTTALNLFPSGPVEQTLEAIITAIKVIGHGALKGLHGLASMRPGGEFLAALNGRAADGRGYRSISADFEPVNAGLKALVAGTVADTVVDRIFEAAANDLVVPEAGVYEVAGAGGFPIPDGQRLRVGPDQGVVHTTFFGHPPVSTKLLEWLDGH